MDDLRQGRSRVLMRWGIPAPSGFAGALLGASMWLPAALGLLTVVFFLSGPGVTVPFTAIVTRANAVPLAILVALLGWVAIALVSAGTARPQSANSQSYAEITNRIAQLRSILEAHSPRRRGYPKEMRQPWFEAEAAIRQVEGMLRASGAGDTRWVAATGYIDAMRLVHRAEEAALLFASDDFVVAIATEDAARLDGSDIPERKSLLAQLKAALRVVSPAAAAGLEGVGEMGLAPASRDRSRQ